MFKSRQTCTLGVLSETMAFIWWLVAITFRDAMPETEEGSWWTWQGVTWIKPNEITLFLNTSASVASYIFIYYWLLRITELRLLFSLFWLRDNVKAKTANFRLNILVFKSFLWWANGAKCLTHDPFLHLFEWMLSDLLGQSSDDDSINQS